MMLILGLVVIGLFVGLALDQLIVHLAVPPDDSDDLDGEEDALDEARVEGPPPASQPSLHAEAGSLVVDASPAQEWARRVLVMGATATLFGVAAARYDDPSHLAVVTAYLSVLLVCAATDALCYRVPNVMTYPAILGAFVLGAAMPGADFLEVLAGGALAGGVLFLPSLLTGGMGVGMGDVKLAAFVGLALGFTNVVPALLMMALAGGAAAVVLLVSGLRKRGEPIPYAPFISAGAMAALLWQGTAFIRLV